MQAAEQDYEKEKLNERIAKLSGGVAVIQVIFLTYKTETKQCRLFLHLNGCAFDC